MSFLAYAHSLNTVVEKRENSLVHNASSTGEISREGSRNHLMLKRVLSHGVRTGFCNRGDSEECRDWIVNNLPEGILLLGEPNNYNFFLWQYCFIMVSLTKDRVSGLNLVDVWLPTCHLRKNMDIALSEQLWMNCSQPFFERRIDIAALPPSPQKHRCRA